MMRLAGWLIGFKVWYMQDHVGDAGLDGVIANVTVLVSLCALNPRLHR